MNLPHGAPSHDTFQRLLETLDKEMFMEGFREFSKELAKKNSKVICIDGKTVRNSGDNPLHFVSAWCDANSLVLGQVKVSDKSNEITVIPKLLKLLNLEGSIVTIDAMSCQREIAEQLIEQGGNYVLGLKGNQGNLQEDVEPYFFDTKNFSGSVSKQ